MSVAKVIEINARSSKSFEDAVEKGVAKASQTVDNIKGAWVKEMKVDVEGGKVTAYDVNMKVTFIIS